MNRPGGGGDHRESVTTYPNNSMSNLLAATEAERRTSSQPDTANLKTLPNLVPVMTKYSDEGSPVQAISKTALSRRGISATPTNKHIVTLEDQHHEQKPNSAMLHCKTTRKTVTPVVEHYENTPTRPESLIKVCNDVKNTVPRPRTDIRAALMTSDNSILSGRRKSDINETSVGDSTKIIKTGYHKRYNK